MTVQDSADRSAVRDSHAFHARLERPGDFIRREWKTLAVSGLAFAGLLLGALFMLDPSFFYPRVETDQLLYLLKAKSLVEDGTTAAQATVNGTPFPYASMPGILRAPFLVLFDDFDAQLRGIQILNIAIATASGFMSGYMISWALPRQAHRIAIAFPFAFMILSPNWITNIFVPLADAPYAALTQGCIILSAMMLTSAKPLGLQKRAMALFAALFTIAFFVRFTAPVLLVHAAILAIPGWKRQRNGRMRWLIPLVVVAATAAFAVLAADTIIGRYVSDIVVWSRNVAPGNAAAYFLVAVIPSQIVPGFGLGFEVSPISVWRAPVLMSTHRDVVWSLLGMGISAVVIGGLVASRRRILPEIAMLCVVSPLLALIASSSVRYMMSYQPILWFAFAVACLPAARFARRHVSRTALRLTGAASITVLAAALVILRSARTAETAGHRAILSLAVRGRAYVNDVETTFTALRHFLEAEPRDSTLLVGGYGDVGRFKVIANRDYYRPDSALPQVSEAKRVYAVLACATASTCAERLMARCPASCQ